MGVIIIAHSIKRPIRSQDHCTNIHTSQEGPNFCPLAMRILRGSLRGQLSLIGQDVLLYDFGKYVHLQDLAAHCTAYYYYYTAKIRIKS